MVEFFLYYNLKIPRSQPVLSRVGGICSIKPEVPFLPLHPLQRPLGAPGFVKHWLAELRLGLVLLPGLHHVPVPKPPYAPSNITLQRCSEMKLPFSHGSELQEAVPAGKNYLPQAQHADEEPIPEVLQGHCDMFGLATVQAQHHSKQNAESQPQEEGATAGC